MNRPLRFGMAFLLIACFGAAELVHYSMTGNAFYQAQNLHNLISQGEWIRLNMSAERTTYAAMVSQLQATDTVFFLVYTILFGVAAGAYLLFRKKGW